MLKEFSKQLTITYSDAHHVYRRISAYGLIAGLKNCSFGSKIDMKMCKQFKFCSGKLIFLLLYYFNG